MKDDIIDIRNNIQAKVYTNEASISQGILQRILFKLDWPTYNTNIVAPEYSVEGRRVDFALCHPPGKPIVFIEVKQPGKIEGADRQLFEYAFHMGVPLAVLTDGIEWHFYLPAEQGNYQERRVYKLDLIERDVEEIIERLNRYLSYKFVCEEKAIQAAREDYKDVKRIREIREALPCAWNKLIEEADDILLELVSTKVESLCGYKPDPDTVLNYLNEKIVFNSQEKTKKGQVNWQEKDFEDNSLSSIENYKYGFELNGDYISATGVKDLLIKAIKAIAKKDDLFLERFSSLPKHGRTRRFISKNKTDLYPSSPHLVDDNSISVGQGFWIGTNVGRLQAENILRLACEVAKIRYGKDMILYF